ncbi:MAG: hypothetical protein ACRDSH_22515 [Pseudonocardiaceae bacterium]
MVGITEESPRAFRRVIEQEYQPWQAGLASGLELQLGVGQLGAVADWRAIPETDDGDVRIRGRTALRQTALGWASRAVK